MHSSKGCTGHKHQEVIVNNNTFWEHTKYSAQNARSVDWVDGLSASHIQNQNIFFDELKMPLAEKETHSEGMPSKIDPTLVVTDKQWVVSLVRKDVHAYIVVESLGFGRDQGLCMRWFDYMPKVTGHANSACSGMFSNPRAFILNAVVPAQPRYCPTNEGNPLSNIPASISRKELFTKLSWNEKTSSCACPASKVMAMMVDIRNDFRLADENKLKFRKRSEFALNSNRIPNCTTWTWKKLRVAGIQAENDSIINHIIVDASHNVGPKHPIFYREEAPQTPSINIKEEPQAPTMRK